MGLHVDIEELQTKCTYGSCGVCKNKLGKKKLCNEFDISTIKNPMTKTEKICDLIIKFKKEKTS